MHSFSICSHWVKAWLTSHSPFLPRETVSTHMWRCWPLAMTSRNRNTSIHFAIAAQTTLERPRSCVAGCSCCFFIGSEITCAYAWQVPRSQSLFDLFYRVRLCAATHLMSLAISFLWKPHKSASRSAPRTAAARQAAELKCGAAWSRPPTGSSAVEDGPARARWSTAAYGSDPSLWTVHASADSI